MTVSSSPARVAADALAPTGSAALLLAACLTIMVGCVLAPALPAIAVGLGVPHQASWLITLPALGVVLFSPVAGTLIARLGARRALLAGAALYGLFGLAGAMLHGAVPVFADRLLLGAATALVMAGGTTLIAEFFEGEARLGMIARQGMAIELGGVVFLFAGGMLAAWSWRGPFLLYLFAWVVLGLVGRFVPATAPTRPADTPAAGGLRALRPLFGIYLAAAASLTVFFTAVIALPPFLGRLGFSAPRTGMVLAAISLVAVGFAFAMPAVTRRVGSVRTLAAAFLFYGLAHLLFRSGSVPLLAPAVLLMGAGFGLSVPLVNHMTIERVAAPMRGHALAILSMAIFLGQFLATLVTIAGPGRTGLSFGLAALLSGAACVAALAASVAASR